jgi:hypothetical protein
MLGMAKQRKPSVNATASRVRVGRNLNTWISADLMDALDELRAQTRRSVKAEVEVMMEKYLGELGLWPRKEKAK